MMQSDSTLQLDNNNVINLFTGLSIAEQASHSIVQTYPENSSIKMLYASPNNPERLIAVPILCWGLRADGEVVGLVPWINEVTDCTTIDQQLDVSWEGYYLQDSDTIFYDAPEAIVAQLATAMRYAEPLVPKPTEETETSEANSIATLSKKPAVVKDEVPVFINSPLREVKSTDNGCDFVSTENDKSIEIELEDVTVVQEIPDLIGTHALLVNDDAQALTLTPVVSWVLDEFGELHGMLVDEDLIDKTPVVPGDDCLYVATSNTHFRCYFQRDIAEQIRVRNPETMAAIEKLLAK